MEKKSKYGLGVRVAMLVGIALVVFAILAAEAGRFRSTSDHRLSEIEATLIPELLLSKRALQEFEALSTTYERAIAAEDLARLDAAKNVVVQIEKTLTEIEDFQREAPAAVLATKLAVTHYETIATELAEALIRQEDLHALNDATALVQTAHNAALHRLEKLSRDVDAHVAASFEKLHAENRRSMWFGMLVRFVGAIVLLLAAILLLRSTLRSFREFRKRFSSLAEGNFSDSFVAYSRDEFGQLCELGNQVALKLNRSAAEERRSKEALQKSANDLALVNTRLSSFVRIASHDLREPTRGLQAYAQALSHDCWDELGTEAKEYVASIEKLARRMGRLVDALLAYSRLGRRELKRTRTRIQDVVVEAMEQLQYLIDAQDAEVVVATELPTLSCDADLCASMLTNLISNGIKYCDNSRPRVEISASTREVGAEIEHVIHITDNGIGMPQKHLERIFTAFKRLNHPDAYGGGVGLGLSIVEDLVRAHGGSIEVQSRVGEGSTFSFTLGAEEEDEKPNNINC